MRHLWLIFLFFFALPALATDVDFYGGLEKQTWDGGPIRLLGIYPNELPNDALIKDFYGLTKTPKNRYGDLLVYPLLANDQWLQEWLLREGRAIVMPVYDLHWGRLYSLKNAEVAGRVKKAGLWGNNPIVCADHAKDAFDSFSIIQGRIKEAAKVRGTIYLNFGDDYRSDFTVKILPKTLRTLTPDMKDKLTALTETPKPDMVIEARGWVFYSGGPMIEVIADAQLDFYETGNPLILERCIQ